MKRAIIALLTFICIERVSADVLFWQVADDSPTFEYAMLRIGMANGDDVDSSGTNLHHDDNPYALNYTLDGGDLTAVGIGYEVPPIKVAADIENNYAAMSFIVELYNAADEMTHVSYVYHFSDLTSYITGIEEFSSSWRSMNAVNVTGFHSVESIPEPTSSLLFIMGAALLGLRRRKRVK